ncbi:MAG: IPT/TIG domain-containing protein [Solirubrobacterales bacterium]
MQSCLNKSHRTALLMLFFMLFSVLNTFIIPPEPVSAAITGVSTTKVSVSGLTSIRIDATPGTFDWSGPAPTVQFSFDPAGYGTITRTATEGDDGYLVVQVPARPNGNVLSVRQLKVTCNGVTLPSYTVTLTYIKDPVISNIYQRLEANVTGYSRVGGGYTFQLTPATPSRVLYLEGPGLETATVVYAHRMVGAAEQIADEIPVTTENLIYGSIAIPYNPGYMVGNFVYFEVKNAANASFSSAPTNYSALTMPSITSFDGNPENLVGLQNLTINGSGFSTTDSQNQVLINNTQLSDAAVTTNPGGTSLGVVVPDPPTSGSGKSIEIRVNKPSGLFDTQILYKNALTINKRPPNLVLHPPLLPNVGMVSGGTKVLMAIEGYDTNTKIYFGNRQATSVQQYTGTVPSYYGWPTGPGVTVLEVTTPASENAQEGRVDIRVENSLYPTVLYDVEAGAFMYTAQAQYLQLTDLSELTGLATGGEAVTLQNNFIKFRSNTASTTDYVADGRYVVGQDGKGRIYGTVYALPRDGSGNIDPALKFSNSTNHIFIRETYPNYRLEDGSTINLVVYSRLEVSFGSSAAKIRSFANFAATNRQMLNVITGPYSLGPNELFKQVDVRANVIEYMYTDAGQYMGPTNDMPFSGFSSSSSTIPPKYFLYKKATSSPAITALAPGALSWKDVGTPRQLAISGWDFFSGCTVHFKSPGRPDVTITDNGSNMLFQPTGVVDGNGRVQKVLTLLDPPDLPLFQSNITTVMVQVVNSDNAATNEFSLTLTSAPKIDDVQPGFGPVGGGNRVCITGSDFYYNPSVWLRVPGVAGTVYAQDVVVLDTDFVPLTNVSIVPGTRILFTTPAAVGGWALPDSFDVIVYNTDTGQYTSKEDYAIHPAPASDPAITSVSPAQGLMAGGTDIVITGSGFQPSAIATIDGVAITNPVVTPTRITGKTPRGSRANVPVPVQVMNPNGGYDIQNNYMYYLATSSPVIYSITPDHGSTGIKAVVYGDDFHFLTVAGGVSLSPATVTLTHSVYGPVVFETVYDTVYLPTDLGKAWVKNENTIELMIPPFLVSGQPRAGQCTLTVRNRDNVVATAPMTFNYQVPMSTPNIRTIEPGFGSTSGGNLVTVTGDNFFTDDFSLIIGGNEAAIVTPVADVAGTTYQKVVVMSPPSATAGFVDVTALNYDGGFSSVHNGFNYTISNANPTISSIAPNTGSSSGGTDLVITGTMFAVPTVIGGVYYPLVTIGGIPAVFDPATYRVSQNRLEVTTPPYMGSGPVDVIITNPDGGSCRSTFNYSAANMTVTSFLPNKIANKQYPTFKVIKGTGFMPPMLFNGQTVATKAYLRYPASGTPTVEYLVYNGTSPTGMTNIPISSTVYMSVYNYEVVSGTQINIVLPKLAASDRIGSWTLRLVNPDNTYIDIPITYISTSYLPLVDLPVDPNQGSVTGGAPVIIRGSGFQVGVKVMFGSHEATSVTVNADGTQMTVIVPAGTEEDIGVVDMAVMNPDGGQVFLPDAFTYLPQESNPTITAITPSEGPTAGGTEVTITGSQFAPGCSVYLGTERITTPVTVSGRGDSIKFTTPAHNPGQVDVIVKNPSPAYGEGKKEKGFTFKGAPPMGAGLFKAEVVAKSAIKLTWPKVTGATNYEISVKVDNQTEWRHLIDSQDSEYYIYKFKTGSYYFRLRTTNADGSSAEIDCTPSPLRIVSSDIEDVTKTGDIQEFSDQASVGSDGRLVVSVGKDITIATGTNYIVNLNDEQRRAIALKLLIPIEGIDQASTKTVVVQANNFALYVPLTALNTFEYQQKRIKGDSAYVEIDLLPIEPRILETASLNRGYRAYGGFTMRSSLNGSMATTPLTYYNSILSVNWKIATPSSGLVPMIMDRGGKRWLNASGSPLGGHTGYAVGVAKPDDYVFFTTQRTR